MSIPLLCIKSHRLWGVKIKPIYQYEPREFLWFRWLAEVHVANLVRCTHPGCGRAQVVSLDGVYVPAEIAPQPPEERADEPERERREPPPPLGLAVRRAEL